MNVYEKLQAAQALMVFFPDRLLSNQTARLEVRCRKAEGAQGMQPAQSKEVEWIACAGTLISATDPDPGRAVEEMLRLLVEHVEKAVTELKAVSTGVRAQHEAMEMALCGMGFRSVPCSAPPLPPPVQPDLHDDTIPF